MTDSASRVTPRDEKSAHRVRMAKYYIFEVADGFTVANNSLPADDAAHYFHAKSRWSRTIDYESLLMPAHLRVRRRLSPQTACRTRLA